MRRSWVIVTITNDTTHVLEMVEGTAGIYRKLVRFHPGMKFDLTLEPDATYYEYRIQRLATGDSEDSLRFNFDDICDYAEISVYTALNGSETWIGTKRQRTLIRNQDQKDYTAKRNEASARMKRVVSVSNKLELRLKMIKICYAQCKHLVQTFSTGIRELTKEYTKVFRAEVNIERLYNTRKLRTIINCLGTLENCVRYTENFLLECAREWKFLALQVSVLFRSPETTTQSKFDCVIGELSWNLDKIRYALLLPGEESSRVGWKWCSIKCRYVFIKAGGSVDHESDGGSIAHWNSDRDYLTRHIEDGSIFAQIQSLIMFKPWAWFLKDGSRKDFGAILKQRLGLQNIGVSSTSSSSSIPAVKTFRISHSHLKFKTKLSKGSFKTIYRGEWLGLEVAIAIIVTEHVEESKFLVEKEAGHLADLQHPNIVAFYGYLYTDEPMLPASFTKDYQGPSGAAGYLVMELMEDDLSRTIDKRMKSIGPFSISVALDIMLQIVEAMVYLHERDIMHRDLKPMNCLVKARHAPRSSNRDVYYNVKLTDFGSAKENVISDNTANPGTTRWMAPEMLRPNNAERVPYTKSGDVFGFAMICYQVITGEKTPKLPACENRDELIKIVIEGERPSFPASLSCPEGLKELIRDCWAGMPDDRPNFKEIRRKLWVFKRDLEVEM